jgi:hypothetical protein
MFIHLGGQIVVRTKEVIAILDYGNNETQKKLQTFLESFQEQEKLVWISKDETKSIVITDHTIYGSPISTLTLNRRA